jgi:hypothetical protein
MNNKNAEMLHLRTFTDDLRADKDGIRRGEKKRASCQHSPNNLVNYLKKQSR